MSGAGTTHRLQRPVAADHPAFVGHFPGQPLLPGVCLLSEVIEAALADPALAARLGAAPRLAAAKFLAPVGPGSLLDIELVPTAGGLAFDVRCGALVVARGQFAAAEAAS